MHRIPTPPTSTKPPNYGQECRRRMYRPAVNLIEQIPDEGPHEQYKECDRPKTEGEFRIWLKQKCDEIKNDRVRQYNTANIYCIASYHRVSH